MHISYKIFIKVFNMSFSRVLINCDAISERVVGFKVQYLNARLTWKIGDPRIRIIKFLLALFPSYRAKPQEIGSQYR